MAKTSKAETEIRRRIHSTQEQIKVANSQLGALRDQLTLLSDLLYTLTKDKPKPAEPAALVKPRKRRAKVASLADVLIAEAIDPALAEPKT